MPRQKKKNKKKTENKMKMATAMIKKRNRERHRLNRNGHFYDGKSSRDNKKKMVAHQRVWRVENKKKTSSRNDFSFIFVRDIFSLRAEEKERKKKNPKKSNAFIGRNKKKTSHFISSRRHLNDLFRFFVFKIEIFF